MVQNIWKYSVQSTNGSIHQWTNSQWPHLIKDPFTNDPIRSMPQFNQRLPFNNDSFTNDLHSPMAHFWMTHSANDHIQSMTPFHQWLIHQWNYSANDLIHQHSIFEWPIPQCTNFEWPIWVNGPHSSMINSINNPSLFSQWPNSTITHSKWSNSGCVVVQEFLSIFGFYQN